MHESIQTGRRLGALLIGLAVLGLAITPAQAVQAPRPPAVPSRTPAQLPASQAANPAGPGGPQVLSPGELQRLFDAYVAMQAQEVLKLSDEQFPSFMMRLKTLQDMRRRNENQRRQLIGELAKLSDEPQIKDKLRALRDLDGKAVADLRRNYDAIDEVLDAKQQARFRVFEQQMERRKFDLMLRARNSERLGNPKSPAR
jgi:hypothetical protein